MNALPEFQKKAFGGVDEQEVYDFLMSLDHEYEAELDRLKNQLNDLLRAGADMKQSFQRERQLSLSLREQAAVLTKENEALKARVEELESERAAHPANAASASRTDEAVPPPAQDVPAENVETMLKLLCEQVAQNRRAIEALEKRLEPSKRPAPLQNMGFSVPEEPDPDDFRAYFK